MTSHHIGLKHLMGCSPSRHWGLVLLLALTGPLLGCNKSRSTSQKAPTHLQRVQNEPEFRIENFIVLNDATQDKTLPYTSPGDGARLTETCFDPQTKLRPWKTTNKDIFELVDANRKAILETVSDWVVATFEEVAGEVLEEDFQVRLKDPRIVHAPNSRIRLLPDQTCLEITEEGATRPGTVITTLFGSKIIEITAEVPIPKETFKAMQAHAKEMGIRLQAAKTKYPRAKEGDGTKIKDEKGRPLFQAPDGSYILRKQIPKPKNRPVVDWRLRLPSPLYYAAGDLPKGSWASESSPELCEVFLVFHDAKAHQLPCDRLNEVGFAVAPGDKRKEVLVKLTVQDKTTSKSIPYHTRSSFLAEGRILVWVTAQKVEEGAKLLVDNVVLFPEDPNALDDTITRTEGEQEKQKPKRDKKKKGKKKKESRDKKPSKAKKKKKDNKEDRATDRPKKKKKASQKSKKTGAPPPPIY